MDTSNDMRDFLTSRRAKITPEQAGLPDYGSHRRVAGLRREEVALLAGVSVDYYNRLERGNARGVSDSVVEALSRALQLDEAERAHLFDLIRRSTTPGRTRRRPARQQVRAGVQRLLDAMTGSPAIVQNGRLDILATNVLGKALYVDMFTDAGRLPPNHARYIFLDPRSQDFYSDWDRAAGDTVALLRVEAGRNPDDRALSDLIGELSTRSEAFPPLWAAHNVRWHTTGTKTFQHPVVGDLTLDFEAVDLAADAGLKLLAYTAEPGSASADALSLLASWTATSGHEQSIPPAGEFHTRLDRP
jgi:transcriptional regulator with XRE-family HTH domain